MSVLDRIARTDSEALWLERLAMCRCSTCRDLAARALGVAWAEEAIRQLRDLLSIDDVKRALDAGAKVRRAAEKTLKRSPRR